MTDTRLIERWLPIAALGACAVGIHGCKSAPVHALGRSISLNIHQYSPQSISQGRGDSEFSLSRIPTAQAPRAPFRSLKGLPHPLSATPDSPPRIRQSGASVKAFALGPAS